ncbi:MAG: hypothetical protein KTR14_07640 [Vampirovibrio sp.]|nr:hypothetical protein [Vampirovibrio sp.]
MISTSLTECLDPKYLPEQPLYGNAEDIGWQLSPTPFVLTQAQLSDIQTLGPILQQFLSASDLLYRQSLKGQQPEWIASVLNQGKPENLLTYGQMKRFKSHLPTVIRPDLLMTADGFKITEIDSVPGGIGFTSALNYAYRESGCSVVQADATMPTAFLEMLKVQVADKESPVVALVVSDEAEDYRQEMTWLVNHLQQTYPNIYCIHPKQLALVRDKLVFQSVSGDEVPIDLIYRFFELFDLPNIPNIDLIQYAIKKGLVQCTPPFKPHLEEKLLLALLHHPLLATFWQQHLGKEEYVWLKDRVPPTWIVDPTVLPPQAVIHGLAFDGTLVQDFRTLSTLSQKQRQLVLKPSGFSPLAWGSRGVTVGHDVSGEEWGQSVDNALNSYEQSPYILQTYEKPSIVEIEQLDPMSGEVTPFEARARFCPYFFIKPGDGDKLDIELSGILATSCPADKKVIHGMRDAVMAPVMAE